MVHRWAQRYDQKHSILQDNALLTTLQNGKSIINKLIIDNVFEMSSLKKRPMDQLTFFSLSRMWSSDIWKDVLIHHCHLPEHPFHISLLHYTLVFGRRKNCTTYFSFKNKRTWVTLELNNKFFNHYNKDRARIGNSSLVPLLVRPFVELTKSHQILNVSKKCVNNSPSHCLLNLSQSSPYVRTRIQP